jgi:hypothetical protein
MFFFAGADDLRLLFVVIPGFPADRFGWLMAMPDTARP